MKTSSKVYLVFKVLLFIFGMITLPALIILAWNNPLIKDYNLFWFMCGIQILALSIFGSEAIGK